MVYAGSDISAFSFLKKFIPKKRIIDAKLIKTPIQGEYILRIHNNTNHVHLISKLLLNGIVFPDNFIVKKHFKKDPLFLFPQKVIQYSLFSSIEDIFETENHFEIHIKGDLNEIVIKQNL